MDLPDSKKQNAVMEAAHLLGAHGYAIVSREELDGLYQQAGVEQGHQLAELFSIDPLTPSVTMHPDDVNALIDQLGESHDPNMVNVQDVLLEAMGELR